MKKKSSMVKLSFSVLLTIVLTFSCCAFVGCNNNDDNDGLLTPEKNYIYAVYKADSSGDDLDSRMDTAQENFLNLLINKGYTEATVTREGTNKLRVEVPDEGNIVSLLESLGWPAEIKFVLQSTGETIITGGNVINATAGYYESSPIVSLSLNSEGAKKFGDATTNNIGRTIDIIITVGGETTTITSAKIESAVTNGKAIITGIGRYESAEQLANQIMSGTFGVAFSLIDFGAFKR